MPAHVLALSEGLLERGWDVEVAAPAASPALQALRGMGVVAHPLRFSRAPQPGDLATAARLRALDRERRFAVVHAHSSKAGALVRAALPGAGRLVYTPHCFAFAASFGVLPGLQRGLYRIAEQALVPRTGAIVAVSEWERDEGRRRLRGSAQRIHVIHNGVPPCGSPAPDAELLAFRGDGRLAGSVCRLDAQKDPLTLVRAAAVLKRRGRLDFRVAVIGNGSLAGDVREEIGRLGLEGDVRAFPFRTRSADYLTALDAFVLPSLWESFPISVLEAMACSTPVIATRVGGTPEAVEDRVSGRLFAPGDPADLATVMDEVLHDPAQLASLGRGGRRAFDERFTLRGMVDAVARLYEQTLERAHR